MATAAAPVATTAFDASHDGSLEGAGQKIQSLLFADEAKDGTARETSPEQRRTPTPTRERTPAPRTEPAEEPEAQQASAAPTEEESKTPPEGSEQTETQEETEQPAQPRTFRVKVDGRDVEVTEDELLKGYSREADYTRKAQHLATLRKDFEERELAAVRKERDEYGQTLGQLKQALVQLRPTEPDWAALAKTLPADQVLQEKFEWEAHTKRIQAVEAEQARVKQQQDADAERGFKEFVAQEQAKLREALPELKDATKGPELWSSLRQTARELGFDDQQFDSVADHRVIVLLNKARLYDLAQKKAPEVKNKIERVLEPAAPGNRTATQPRSKLTQAKERLRSTGSLDDAAAAIEQLL